MNSSTNSPINSLTDPKYIGPGVWYNIHLTAYNATDDDKIDEFIEYMYFLSEKFACKKCRQHIKKYIETHPLNDLRHLTNADGRNIGMFKWAWLFHNAVNTRIHKPYVDWETAWSMYDQEIEVCTASCDEIDNNDNDNQDNNQDNNNNHQDNNNQDNNNNNNNKEYRGNNNNKEYRGNNNNKEYRGNNNNQWNNNNNNKEYRVNGNNQGHNNNNNNKEYRGNRNNQGHNNNKGNNNNKEYRENRNNQGNNNNKEYRGNRNNQEYRGNRNNQGNIGDHHQHTIEELPRDSIDRKSKLVQSYFMKVGIPDTLHSNGIYDDSTDHVVSFI